MGDGELERLLLEQLRAAFDTALKIGDKGAVYFVERALFACINRWGNSKQSDVPPIE